MGLQLQDRFNLNTFLPAAALKLQGFEKPCLEKGTAGAFFCAKILAVPCHGVGFGTQFIPVFRAVPRGDFTTSTAAQALG